MGKEFEKKVGTCICITESLCCTLETNTTLFINFTPVQNKKVLKIKLPCNTHETHVILYVNGISMETVVEEIMLS